MSIEQQAADELAWFLGKMGSMAALVRKLRDVGSIEDLAAAAQRRLDALKAEIVEAQKQAGEMRAAAKTEAEDICLEAQSVADNVKREAEAYAAQMLQKAQDRLDRATENARAIAGKAEQDANASREAVARSRADLARINGEIEAAGTQLAEISDQIGWAHNEHERITGLISEMKARF